MAHAVQLQYDPSLPHQVAAVESVVDLFEDALVQPAGAGPADELGFANPSPRDDAAFDASLLARLRQVQRRNGLPSAERLDGRHFTVEMETGTGKTYVYLRTIFELHARYGLTKFVIAVPSVAIREGVLTALRSTAEHFRARYATPLDHAVYDSRRLNVVRGFATSTTLHVLVMNVQSFQQDAANVINRPHDGLAGRRPIELVQAVRPVVIVDEPQNFESEGARTALARLDPLCTLRYSATPRNPYNLVYRLGPVAAFEHGLVKQIEVDGVEPEATFDDGHVRLLAVDPARDRAQVELDRGRGEAVRRARAWVRRGEDLAVRSNGRPEYRDGFRVDDVVFAAGREAIEFSGGTVLGLGALSGAAVGEVQRLQVRRTIHHHLDRERELAPRGIKVLSLFFLDTVADYRVHAADGTHRLGPLGELFEAELRAALTQPRYAVPAGAYDAAGGLGAVHGAYFSQDGRGCAKDSRGDGEGDRATYETIMRGKERLLSPAEPLRFLFTHSALREGWDNPNVFQVCTLARTRSAITRRQQIGRGLRLPVDEHGARVRDPEVARLTVVANESYDAFARGLQVDYEHAAGVSWAAADADAAGAVGAAVGVPPVRDARRRVVVALHEQELADAGFRAFWDDVARRTRCRVRLDSVRIVRKAVARIGAMDPIRRPEVRAERARLTVSGAGVAAGEAVAEVASADVAEPVGRAGAGDRMGLAGGVGLPDVLGELQNATGLTRATLVRILDGCGRLDELALNPQAFVVAVTRIVRAVLRAELLEGVEYVADGSRWEAGRLAPATCRSELEEAFAHGFERDARVRFRVKLPDWFVVDTPVGAYVPDWAICWDDGAGPLHVVVATRRGHGARIGCARAHFAALGVPYRVVGSVEELARSLQR